MKALVLNASPNKEGFTARLLGKLLEKAEFESEKYDLFAMDIAFCNDCKGCKGGAGCVIDDDMTRLYAKLETADIIIVATPVYFGSVPAPLKALIDRLNAIWHRRDKALINGRKCKGIALCTMGGDDERDLKGVDRLVKVMLNVIGAEYAGMFEVKGTDSMSIERFELAAEETAARAYNAIKR